MGLQEQDKFQFSVFKQRLFDFTKQLVSNEMSTNLYLLFVIIENLQFVAYHNNGLLTYHVWGFKQLGQVMKYLNLAAYLQESNINMFMVPLFSVLTALHIGIILYGYKAYQHKIEHLNRSIQDRNFHKNRLEYFINLLMICFTTFLTIPIFQTSITAIYCTSSNPFTNHQSCYTGEHIVIMLLGLFNILWLLLVNVYYALYYYSRNPFSASFLTVSSNWWSLGKFSIKVTPMIYFMYDPIIEFSILFLIVMTASYGGYIGLFRIFLPYYRYNFRLERIIFSIEGFTLLFNACFIVIHIQQSLTQNQSIILPLWALMSCLIVKVALDLFINIKKGKISEIHSLDKNKLTQIEEYLIYLIDQTETNFKQDRGFFLIGGLAKSHRSLCEDPQCYCHSFFQMIKQAGYNTNITVFYTVILSIIDRIIQHNKKAYSFFILKAYILYYKMSAQIKAATTISIIMSDKLDFSDQMLVKGLLFELDQQYNDTRDMEIYRKFNEYLLQQEEQSLKLVNLYLQYWQELIDQKSSLSKLHLLLRKINKSKAQLHRIVEGGLSIFHNHVRVLLIYKNFLRQVLNDYLGYIKCQEKYKVGLKENKLTNVDAVNTIQFRPNQNLLVINLTRHYSTHSQIMGNYQVISISSNVKEFLGFTNNELRGQSINKLIPRVYHTVHDQMIDKILNKKDSQIVSRQIRIFPINSAGHIIECNIISKFMPSIGHGINIVSFLEQCDKNKDEFFIIYDGNTGMVDSMNAEAQSMLKDGTRRKMNDMLAIPDHINDLLPNWDFRLEEWRANVGRGKSLKSISNMNEFKYEVRQIELIRSDGLTSKYIKVLKFKGDYFVRMFSIDNESYKESNTIQQYLDYQKSDRSDLFNKMDSAQLQDMIRVQTKKIIQRDFQRKKTINQMKKIEKSQAIIIQQMPSQVSRAVFITLQWMFFIIALSLTCYELIVSNINMSTYNEDSNLLITMSKIQTLLSDTTYISSLVTTEEAYSNSQMVLPYDSYVSSIEMVPQLQEITSKMTQMDDLINKINPILIQMINKGEMTEQSITVEVRSLLKEGTKQYYKRKMNIIQASFQYIQHAKDIVYRMLTLKQSVEMIIGSANYFFIFANSLSILPENIISLKNNVLYSISEELDLGFKTFLVVKLLAATLIVLSTIITMIYYRFTYESYIWRVIHMYENIKVEKIKIYEDKCNKYKDTLSEKDEKFKSRKSNLSSHSLGQVDEIKVSDGQYSINVGGQDDDQNKLLQIKDEKQEKMEEVEHFLNFQQIPSLKNLGLVLLVWVLLYGVLLFSLCYTYFQATTTLKDQITRLNKYTLMQNSVIQIRLYSQLSLNMLNYWDADYLNIVNNELQKYFDESLYLANDTSLNFTTIKPIFASKFQQFRVIQSYVLNKNFKKLNELASNIESQLQSIDDILQVLQAQCESYLAFVESQSIDSSNKLNICIALSVLFIIMFWTMGTKYNYHRLIEQHQLAYEMYHIIGYNLRKELEKG